MGPRFDFSREEAMSRLIKIADWRDQKRVNVVFVHGLGGHAYDTWRRSAEDKTFWPVWLSRDIPGLVAWTLAYDAPPTNWLGTAMPIQDRAKNVLECLLGQRELKDLPLVFVCHSLGGLVVKQVLRTANDRRDRCPAEAGLVDSVKGVVFIATPHTGSMQATLLDRLRLIAWPSASTLDLVKNNANLRDLNVWYRNWSVAIRHKVFYEKVGTVAGVVVADDSSDPGLLNVDPVAIDADHVQICKPTDTDDMVYARTRDFIVDEIESVLGRPA
jgi:pimeloyl-ACP methyl ester carboxylesterase